MKPRARAAKLLRRMDPAILPHFLTKLRFTSRGCWIWTGCRHETGYGLIVIDGKKRRAHRVAYEAVHGAYAPGTVTDHLCRNRACCNPTHLEAVTPATNTARGLGAKRTHCPAGHRYTAANSRQHPRGYQQCRICWAAYMRQYRLRKRPK